MGGLSLIALAKKVAGTPVEVSHSAMNKSLGV
jgi:hypothetical protein